MKIINIQAAKTHLSRLVEEAAAGADIVIAKAGKPLVRLAPYHVAAHDRLLGSLAGQVWEAPDCWAPDEPLEKVLYGEAEGHTPAAPEEGGRQP